MQKLLSRLPLALAALLCAAALPAAATLAAKPASDTAPPAVRNFWLSTDDLRVDNLREPLGIETTAPRFSWKLNLHDRAPAPSRTNANANANTNTTASTPAPRRPTVTLPTDTSPPAGRGVAQTSYRILVATSPEKITAETPDIWDSGVVKSDASVLVPYAGSPLKSRTHYYWNVLITAETPEKAVTLTAVSPQPLATFSTGIRSNEWQAKWIGLDKFFKGETPKGRHSSLAGRYFRKEFSAAKKPAKAILYVSGLGIYKLSLNGKILGTHELSPLPTDYTKTIKYDTLDVTNQITSGKNALGVALGCGWFFGPTRVFATPRLLLQLELQHADGSKEIIVSNDSWKTTADGPIRANSYWDGESYDARKEMPGWDKPNFDDSHWTPAQLVKTPSGKLEGATTPNITITETLKPISIKKQKDNVFLLDMGQNMVGWLQIKTRGKAGDTIKLRFAETLKKDGTIYTANFRSARATDTYTLKGDGEEKWEPSFTYHGFRYVEITGYPGTPSVNDFLGKVVHDAMSDTGFFLSSNKTLDQIYKNAFWGIRGNYHGMPTDCPQRDERYGWLGDRAIGSHGESFLFDNHTLYAKWLDDIAQAQRHDGSIPDVAPTFISVYSDNMTWPGTFIIIANMLYEQYGDTQPIIKHYAAMKKWLNYMKRKYCRNGILVKDKYGDWCMPPESPSLVHSKDPSRKTNGAVLGTTFYYRTLKLMERFATIQNKPDDARYFATEALATKNAHNKRFLNPATANYDNGTVTANVLSLAYGMVPEGLEKKVFDNIVRKTEVDFKGHVSSGLVGLQWLMRTLANNGGGELAYKIATNRDYPSWGYMIENDATTIWELWNGNTANPSMNSHNHVMLLGDLLIWYYEELAGIKAGKPGFKQIIMRPRPPADLKNVSASYNSPYGTIESAWQKADGKFFWHVKVPVNTTAIVHIPSTDRAGILESGGTPEKNSGIKFLRVENGSVVYEVASGRYQFSAPLDQRWPLEKAQAWQKQNGWLRGCNFTPSTACNQLEMWQAETFDPKTIDRELGYAQDLGFNCMRVFLHHAAWVSDKEGFKKRIKQYLDISSKRGIKTVLVFFDDCWNAEFKTGKQPEPIPGAHNSRWLRDPGNLLFRRPELITTLEAYVKDILTEFKDDSRIVLWDLYNEPGNSGYGIKSLPLVKNIYAWARTINPSQPLTTGVFDFNKNYNALNAFHTTHSDVLTYHCYGSLADHKKRVAWVRAQSGTERPVVCTEYMQRAKHSGFQAIMPWQKEANIGAINWGLVAGRTQTNIPWGWRPKDKNNPEPPHWSFDLLRKDGTPYVKEEGDIIRKLCK
ncbi:MAG: family 78 glycoside hydrolase catalytic domain [Puniceicoccales bacterium]|nr:family 78 glycoside hydrolase catalytic domain [Puniceicoccales bacterium]